MMRWNGFLCPGLSLGLMLALASVANGQQVVRNATWSSDVMQVPADADTGKSPVITAARIQPGGKLVAVTGDNHIVYLLDRGTGRFSHQLEQHEDWVRAARFSPDGKLLATAGNDRQVLIWDMDDLAVARKIAGHPAAIVDLAFSPDGKWLATAGFENRVRVYEVASGRMERELTLVDEDLRSVAFSPDGAKLAVGGRTGSIEVFETAGWSRTAIHPVHSRRIRELTFLSATVIASCSDEQIVRILDLDRPEAVRDLPNHGGKLFALCRLGNDLLATGGSDNTVYVWNAESGELVRRLEGHTGTVSSLDSQDGILLSGGYDTRIRFWVTEKVARASEPSAFLR